MSHEDPSTRVAAVVQGGEPGDRGPTLVTGAGGFLGLHLCRALRARGDEPIRTRRTDAGHDDPAARWIRCDLTDARSVDELLAAARPARIVHLAGFASGDSSLAGARQALELNVRATGNLLLAAAAAVPTARVVVAGTLEASSLSDAPVRFHTAYGASKQMVELTVRMMRELHGQDAVCVRIGNTYGPDEPNVRRLVPHVVLGLLRGDRPAVSSGTRRVDWIHVDDVVAGLLRAADHVGPLPPTLDLGTGIATAVREVVTMLSDHVGAPDGPVFGEMPDRPGDQCVADVAATRAVLGWVPRIALSDGIAQTVGWYRARCGGA